MERTGKRTGSTFLADWCTTIATRARYESLRHDLYRWLNLGSLASNAEPIDEDDEDDSLDEDDMAAALKEYQARPVLPAQLYGTHHKKRRTD